MKEIIIYHETFSDSLIDMFETFVDSSITNLRKIDLLIEKSEDILFLKFALELRNKLFKNSKPYTNIKYFVELFLNSDNEDTELFIITWSRIMELLFLSNLEDLELFDNILSTYSCEIGGKGKRIIKLYENIIKLNKRNHKKYIFTTDRILKNLVPILNSENAALKSTVMMFFVKYLKENNNSELFSLIIKQIIENYNWVAMCALSSHFVLKSNDLDLHNMIQTGLKSTDASIRKQAMHVLKQLSFIKQEKHWQYFIILYETLEEKQLHLLTPSLSLLKSLEQMQSNWISCIYIRMLDHHNLHVARYAVLFILKNVKRVELLNIIQDRFLICLNNIYLYETNDSELPEICIYFIYFFKSLSTSELHTFLDQCCKINWKPVPLFYIIYCLQKSQPKEIKLNTLQSIFDILPLIQNIYVRQALESVTGFLLIQNEENLMEIQKLKEVIKIVIHNSNLYTSSSFLSTLYEKVDGDIVQQAVLSQTNKNIHLVFKYLFSKQQLKSMFELYFNKDHYHVDDYYTMNNISMNYTSTSSNLQYYMKISKECFKLMESNSNINEIDNLLVLADIILKQSKDHILLFSINLLDEYSGNFTGDLKQYVFVYFLSKLIPDMLKTNTCGRKIYIILCSLPELNICDNKNETMQTRIMIDKYYICINNIYQHVLEHIIVTIDITENILTHVSKCLEVGGRESLISSMELLSFLIALDLSDTHTDNIINVLRQCWNECISLKKCELYIPSLKTFMDVLFQEKALKYNAVLNTAIDYAKLIIVLSHTTTGVMNLLLKKLEMLPYHLLLSFSWIIVEGLLFGANKRKDQRIEVSTLKYIDSELKIKNDYNADKMVRLNSITILSKYKKEEDKKVLFDEIAKRLMKHHDECTKPRYYADSELHHMKNRVLQGLLFILPCLNKPIKTELFKWLKNLISTENSQLSVKRFTEWLLILLMYEDEAMTFDLRNYTDVRSGITVSYITILYHLVQLKFKSSNDRGTIDRAITTLLQCTMGQNFAVRLHSQIVIKKLYEFAENLNLTVILDKYEIFYKTVCTALIQKKAEEMIDYYQDFFFTEFHPIKHHNVLVIYNEFPQFTQASDDSINIDDLKLYFHDEYPVINYKKNSTVKNEKVKDCDDEDTKINAGIENLIIQKKIITDDVSSKKNTENGLIVVASLIDRAPNLGGLCRTCEIFSVSELVVDNIKITENKDFQNLSVSADKWLNMKEIKAFMLEEYLNEMKGLGYIVIGAEQTSRSILLNNVEFPKKALVLLGNEKEGIPANLLHLLDICVEIPQKGVIRSLNVHTCGALFIWEYSKQHANLI